ncbi:hypothetical protein ACOMHN_022956 [Nucella lapillus]
MLTVGMFPSNCCFGDWMRREKMKEKNRAYSRLHYQRLKEDPQRYARRRELMRAANRTYQARKRTLSTVLSQKQPTCPDNP